MNRRDVDVFGMPENVQRVKNQPKNVVKANKIQGAIKLLKDNKKLKVDVYVPLQVCSCQWESFMNRVFEVLTPYIQYINHDTKSLHSEEAAKMNLFQKCVIIDGEKITSIYSLKKKLPKILKKKGLIENVDPPRELRTP
jgi:hypothetical protein